MKELEGRLTQKGQVTIPLEIRSRLGLKPRDRVVFELAGDEVKLRPASSKILQGYGTVTPRNRPEDFRELREAFVSGVAEQVSGEK